LANRVNVRAVRRRIAGPHRPFILKVSEPVTVTVDGQPYQLALRFKRTYKPFSLTLHDVRAEKYLGD